MRGSVAEVLLVIFIAIAISAIIGAALFLGLRIAPNVGWVDVAVAWGFITLTSVGATLLFYITFKIRIYKRRMREDIAEKIVKTIYPMSKGEKNGNTHQRD